MLWSLSQGLHKLEIAWANLTWIGKLLWTNCQLRNGSWSACVYQAMTACRNFESTSWLCYSKDQKWLAESQIFSYNNFQYSSTSIATFIKLKAYINILSSFVCIVWLEKCFIMKSNRKLVWNKYKGTPLIQSPNWLQKLGHIKGVI